MSPGPPVRHLDGAGGPTPTPFDHSGRYRLVNKLYAAVMPGTSTAEAARLAIAVDDVLAAGWTPAA